MYKTQTPDAHPQAEHYYFKLMAGLCINERFRRAVAFIQEWVWLQGLPTDMSYLEVAIQVTELLNQIGVDYFITGGFASIAYAEKRVTDDIDFVVSADPAQQEALLASLECSGFYVAGQGSSMPQAIHQDSIFRCDFIISGREPFDLAKMQRRQSHRLGNQDFYLISPEDLILAKLVWSKTSQSEKQWRDILGILKTQTALDYHYMLHWAERLEQADRLIQALQQAGLSHIALDSQPSPQLDC